jgi:hypothetical protein
MCCTSQRMAALAHQNIGIMADAASVASAPARRDEQPAHTSLPTRTLSREDLELAEHLVDHSQGLRDGERGNERQQRDHSYEIQQNDAATYRRDPGDHPRQHTPTATVGKRNQPDEVYSPQTIMGPDSAPNGQICRLIYPISCY